MSQLAFDLGHRPAFGREDFLVASGSRDAVGWIDRWPNWPGHALALHGPAGCGKTHLAHVFALRTKASIIAGADLQESAVAKLVEDNAALVLEDGENTKSEHALLHLFNALKERSGFLLLTGREPPARWKFKLADLTSRLAAVPSVRISPPDDALMEAVLVKLFSDRQLSIDPDVVGYLMRRMDRSFAAARDIVAKADTAALAGKRAITVPLMREILES